MFLFRWKPRECLSPATHLHSVVVKETRSGGCPLDPQSGTSHPATLTRTVPCPPASTAKTSPHPRSTGRRWNGPVSRSEFEPDRGTGLIRGPMAFQTLWKTVKAQCYMLVETDYRSHVLSLMDRHFPCVVLIKYIFNSVWFMLSRERKVSVSSFAYFGG